MPSNPFSLQAEEYLIDVNPKFEHGIFLTLTVCGFRAHTFLRSTSSSCSLIHAMIRPLSLSIPCVCMMQGDFGPFRPSIPVQVPLWLALRLRADSLCTIIPPSWMTAGACLLDGAQRRTLCCKGRSIYAWESMNADTPGTIVREPPTASTSVFVVITHYFVMTVSLLPFLAHHV